MADPGQQPGRPGADDQVTLGVLQADLAGLLERGMVVLGQPGQAGDCDVVVTLVDGERHGPFNQALDPGRDGRPLGKSTGHGEDPSPPPRRSRRPMVGVSYTEPKGGQVGRTIQVLGVALMAAGLLLDSSLRTRNRRAASTSDRTLTSRLPLLLFWIGAVLLVLASI